MDLGLEMKLFRAGLGALTCQSRQAQSRVLGMLGHTEHLRSVVS
jgi:hypothetical protein